ncbi:MAG: tetratricopeptide repeat protein [Bacteroidota bacterium]
MSKQFFWLFLLMSLLLLSFLTGGCAIFSPVGKVIATGYENMVTYFNTYYDAKRIFDEAEEDAKTFLLEQRGKEIEPPLPADLLKKFDIVIDKCSNILAFHRNSTSADDALFLIGKSFFYQREYAKAEKKFVELISRDPNSSLYSESQLWYIRTLERENRIAEAIAAAETLLIKLEQDKNDEMQYKFRLEIGRIDQQQRQYVEAAEQFSKARSLAGSDEDQIPPLLGLGDCANAQKDYTAAAAFYLEIPKLTSDLYTLFSSRLNAAISYRRGGMLAQSLALLNAMIDDFHMKDYKGYIYLERGRTERKLNSVQDALSDFHLVDTTFRQTPLTYEASYELGSLDEKMLMDYPAALNAYTQSIASTDAGIADSARQKARALSLYLEARQRLRIADSLLSIRWDTVTAFHNDTSAAASRDSVGKQKRSVKIVPPSADSLRAVKSVSNQEIGDVLYAEMEMPDSAISYYLKAEALCKDSLQMPRILFVLSELAHIDSAHAPLSSAEYLKSIIRQYPESPYANQARRNLGWTIVQEKEDSAKVFYERGEHSVDEGQYMQALENFSVVEKRYPLSPLAAKSVYAKGWVYEYRLKNYDSVKVQYKILERKYTSSYFARLVHRRILEENSTGASIQDTLKKVIPDIFKRTVPDSLKKVLPDTLKKTVPDTIRTTLPRQQKLTFPTGQDTVHKASQTPIKMD